MVDDNQGKGSMDAKDRLGPGSSFLLSFLLWSIVIVPLSIGVLFMFQVFPKYTDLGNQYSAVLGLFIGLIISGIVGYIYSLKARKLAK